MRTEENSGTDYPFPNFEIGEWVVCPRIREYDRYNGGGTRQVGGSDTHAGLAP